MISGIMSAVQRLQLLHHIPRLCFSRPPAGSHDPTPRGALAHGWLEKGPVPRPRDTVLLYKPPTLLTDWKTVCCALHTCIRVQGPSRLLLPAPSPRAHVAVRGGLLTI
jgi:hypothetical protein